MSGDIQISPHVGEIFVKYGVRRQYRSGEVLLEKGAPSTQVGFLAVSYTHLTLPTTPYV